MYFLFFFYLFLAIAVSFLCSILEAVLLSITPSYVGTLEQQGNPSGERLRALKDDVDRPLSAILSLNTIAHTVGAAGVGAQGAIIFGEAALGYISAILTILILILSEIIPKTLGVTYWKSLAPLAARVLEIVIFITWPLVWLSRVITGLLANKEGGKSVSRAEISAMADIGAREGVFAPNESRILKNLVRFRSIKTEDIMTPRTVVFMAPEETSVGEFHKIKGNDRFSRIPIYRGTVDNITGYIHRLNVLEALANDKHGQQLKQLKRDITVVDHELSINQLFTRLVEQRDHIALVTDEYGGTEGIVTMEDVLETLLGMEIVDEFDNERDMQEAARRRSAERARQRGLVGPDSPEAPRNAPEPPRNDAGAIARHGITGGTPPSAGQPPKEPT